VDGTLVGADFAVSRRSASVLSRVAAAGSVIVLVTGRSVRRLAQVFEELGTRYAAICANGAVVYDAKHDAPCSCRLLEPTEASEACQRLRERLPTVMFAAELDCGRLLHTPGWPLPIDEQHAACLVTPEELTARPVAKLQARVPGRDAESLKEVVTNTVGGVVEATYPGYEGLVEMTRRGVTKASALDIFAAKLGIRAADALAFGDMPNDISMLHWAGRSVAVANAHPEAQAAADEVTLSNAEDGVAVYLETLLTSIGE
jgi:Cof subfamily protein (haloacid dehalogenase superfamily)